MSETLSHAQAFSQLKARSVDRYGETKVKIEECLTARFRCEKDADAFAALVEAANGGVWECAKTRRARFTGDLTWKVEFTHDDLQRWVEQRSVSRYTDKVAAELGADVDIVAGGWSDAIRHYHDLGFHHTRAAEYVAQGL